MVITIKGDKIDQRSRYSQKAIYEAYLHFLETKPPQRITVTDICRYACLNRGTFYRYYADVPDLAQKIENSLVQEFIALMESIVPGQSSPATILQQLFLLAQKYPHLNYFMGDRAYANHLLRKLQVYYMPPLQELVTANNSPLNVYEQSLLMEYIKGGCSQMFITCMRNPAISPKEAGSYMAKFLAQTLCLSKNSKSCIKTDFCKIPF